jgi:beta-phosphoglucomutase-like phosphatase (HAD superfamily)
MTEEKIAVERHFAGSEARHSALKAALIDMDGVLYDSMKGHTAAWYRMACELGIECTRDEFYAYEVQPRIRPRRDCRRGERAVCP